MDQMEQEKSLEDIKMKVVTYAESANTDAIKVLLLLASDIASEKGNNLLSKKVKKICFEIENECLVPQKLSGVQAAACRKFVDLSVNYELQYPIMQLQYPFDTLCECSK